jgi:hypothetical protein
VPHSSYSTVPRMLHDVAALLLERHPVGVVPRRVVEDHAGEAEKGAIFLTGSVARNKVLGQNLPSLSTD